MIWYDLAMRNQNHVYDILGSIIHESGEVFSNLQKHKYKTQYNTNTNNNRCAEWHGTSFRTQTYPGPDRGIGKFAPDGCFPWVLRKIGFERRKRNPKMRSKKVTLQYLHLRVRVKSKIMNNITFVVF